MTDLAFDLISQEEGRVAHAYLDSEGFWTIGVGALIDARKGGALCDEAIDAQLHHDIGVARNRAAAIPGYDQCNEVRQAVLTSMCFQLGSLRDWPNFRKCLQLGDWEGAAQQMLASKWATQTPKRAQRQAQMMRSGAWQ